MTAQEGRTRLIVKAGEPGPRYQLGHAHCDMLSYELTSQGKRIIVDSGVSSYDAGPMRSYCRGTRAHNTVCVNGLEQIEYWSRFRTGRIYRPSPVHFGFDNHAWHLRASHNGFDPFTHERVYRLQRSGYWLIFDRVSGPGPIAAENYVHFHPAVRVTGEGNLWSASLGDVTLTIVPLNGVSVTLETGKRDPYQGWYCPGYGIELPAPCLVMRASAERLLTFAYAIVPLPKKMFSEDDLRKQIENVDQVFHEDTPTDPIFSS